MKKLCNILIAGLLAFSFFGCGEEEENNTGTEFVYTDANATISTPTVWKSGTVKVIDCTLNVSSTLTIEPGCTVKFSQNGSMKVGEFTNGAIIANGTAEHPIRFTNALDTQGDITSVLAQKGYWYGIYFGERNQSNVTRFKNCIFEGAGKNNTPCIELYKTSIFMDSCTVSRCADMGIQAGIQSGFTTFSHNKLSDCDGFLLSGIPESLVDLDTTNTYTPSNNKGIAMQEGTIGYTCTLTDQGTPYILQGSVEVENGELTIEKGTTLRFDPDAALNFGRNQYAALIAEGTAEQPIRFTSSATTPQAGDWEGLIFFEANSSERTIIKHAIIEYAGKVSGAFEGAIHTYSSIKVENTTIKDSKSYGIWCGDNAGFTSFTNNTIQGSESFPICMNVGKAHTIGANNVFTDNEENGILLTDQFITGDVRWLKLDVPYVIMDGILVQSQTAAVKLTLNPGCSVKFLQGQGMSVGANGTLYADGTAQLPITFSSYSPNPSPGDWTGICFEEDCNGGNLLNHCTVEYAGDYTDFNIGIRTSNVSITNCAIRHSEMDGIFIFYNEPALTPTLQNNTFEGNLGQNISYEQ